MRRLLIAVCLFCSLLAYAETPLKPTDIGRFQIVIVPASVNTPGGDVYMLDTSTGSVWRAVYMHNLETPDIGAASNPRVWVPMSRFNSDKELADFVAQHQHK
jgi:hypothetical protein